MESYLLLIEDMTSHPVHENVASSNDPAVFMFDEVWESQALLEKQS